MTRQRSACEAITVRLIHDGNDSTDRHRGHRTRWSCDRDRVPLARRRARTDAKTCAAMRGPAAQAIDAGLERI